MGALEQEVDSLRGRVRNLEDQVEFLYRHLGLTYDPNSVPTDDPRIIEQLKKGNLIEAIKIYRQTYNVGLAEAKKAVEELKARGGY